MRTPLSFLAGLALVAMTAANAHADAAAGKAIFADKGCTDCHYTEGPAQEKTIDDQLSKKGPELWYAGSKFQEKWLNGWLQDPKPIRPLAYNSLDTKNAGDHPKLSGDEAGSMTEFLMSLTTDKVEAGKVKPKKNPKGKLIFTKKMPCSGCHQYPGKRKKLSGGLTGPTLVDAKSRLNPDWIYAYLSNTTFFKPVRDMPEFKGLLSDKDILNVSRYVANFKNAK